MGTERARALHIDNSEGLVISTLYQRVSEGLVTATLYQR